MSTLPRFPRAVAALPLASASPGVRRGGAAPFKLPEALASIFRAYALIGFSSAAPAGLCFCLATLVVPAHGLAGLIALISANLWARLLGRPIERIADGYYGLNGLLVGLALGLWFRVSWPLALVLVLAGLLTTLTATAVRQLATRAFGVPALCLPFVLVTWVALLATRRFAELEITLDTVTVVQAGAAWLPSWAEGFVRSLAATFFQLSPASGLLVLAGLLWSSRWAVILGALGYASGTAVYAALGGPASDVTGHLVGFNFILTAIAFGGVFVVLGPASLLLATAAAALAAIVSAAALTWLETGGLPILALPFVAVTQLGLMALALRARAGGPVRVPGVPGTPEQNLRRHRARTRRYPNPATPAVFLPVMGRWVVTQGVEGPLTHRPPWAHAWDFEIEDADGRRHRNDGLDNADYYAFGAPVVAPADGRVVAAVDHLPDTPVGEVDTTHNWGNLLVLWHAGEVYSLLCHLQQGSAQVTVGQHVQRGQVLARVGSSGRSPVPHLHFQLQRSPEVGAPTVPAVLLHYLRADGEYMTHGVPEAGEVIEAAVVDPAVRDALTLAPGRQWAWQIRTDHGIRQERWESRIDPLGRRTLQVDGGSGRASLYADGQYLTVLDYEGDGTTLLALFAMAAARVPFVPAGQARWQDQPSVAPLLPLPVRLGHELLLPVVDLGTARTESRLTAVGDAVVLHTDVAGRLPQRIEVVWRVGVGPCAVTVYRGHRAVLTAEVPR